MFKKKEKARVLVLIDWENLLISAEEVGPETFSVVAGFDKIIEKIGQEVGSIVEVFVFTPPHLAYLWGKRLYELGFTTIVCPKIESKEGIEIDTTDQIIIDFGKKMINEIKDLTHLCIGSGDKDFRPLWREAMRKGLKRIVIAGSKLSLASEVIKLANKIYIFSPSE